jgi:hypothetical protein
MNSEEKEIYSIYSDWRNQRRNFFLQLIFSSIFGTLTNVISLSEIKKVVALSVLFVALIFIYFYLTLMFLLFIRDTQVYIHMMGLYDASSNLIEEIKNMLLPDSLSYYLIPKSVWLIGTFGLMMNSIPDPGSIWRDPYWLFSLLILLGDFIVNAVVIHFIINEKSSRDSKKQ